MDKLKTLTQYHQSLTKEERYKFSLENLEFLGVKEQLDMCREKEDIYSIAEIISSKYITGDVQLKKYIEDNYGDFAVTDTTMKNFLKYGYLRDAYTKAGSKKIINKDAVNDIFSSNIIHLNAEDYFEALQFSLKMLEKVENLSLRFGTFFDKIAKRNGTALNYIERHLVGKLGETATIKLINNELDKLESNFKVENSFKTDQVEAADIVQLKDKKDVIVNAGCKVQIKTSTGLNSVVLKEDKTKLESDTFSVDYCVFVQLLNSPLNFIIELVQKINERFQNTNDINLTNILNSINISNQSICMSAKVAGFTDVNDMSVVEKGDKLLPLGDITSDSYYLYVADLKRDFNYLAKQLLPK